MTAAASALRRATPASGDRPSRFDVLGVPVSAVDLPAAVAVIEGWIDSGARHFVCVTGVHGVIESRDDAELGRAYWKAGLVTPDGMPLVWTAWCRGLAGVGRVYGPDLMLALSGPSARAGRRHYYFGGGEGIADLLHASLAERNPDLHVVGCHTPPFRPLTPQEEDAVIAEINAARPDILWIGLSTPKQELWMARYRDRLTVPVIIGVGAAFDFLSDTKRQAPVWMRGAGLEWLFRLLSEPRRLFGRYARIVPRFAVFLAAEICRHRVWPRAAGRAARKA